MAADSQEILFAKALADNCELATQTGLRNLLTILETGSDDVVNGSSYFPGAFDAWKTLVDARPDLFTREFRHELEQKARPAVPRVTLGKCPSCGRELRAKPSGVHVGMKHTCKCGTVSAIAEAPVRAALAQNISSLHQTYGQQAASYALRFLPALPAEPPSPPATPASPLARFLARHFK